MRVLAIGTLIILFIGCISLSGCTAKMHQKIQEKTNLGMDDLVKGKDMSQEMALKSNISSDPVLKYYFLQKHFTGSVSHGVATLTGKLRTQELVDQVIALAWQVKGIKDVVSELVVDPNIEEQPFEW